MSIVNLQSIRPPFTSPRLTHEAITTLARAEAMGLLPEGQRIETLDLTLLRKVLGYLRRAGIGRGIVLDDASPLPAVELERLLERINAALEESPVPEREWSRLVTVLDVEELARLLGISTSSVRRYKAAARTTPHDVAGRLHFLALVVGDLSGAYNDMGIRQWFERKRAQLDGQAPGDILGGDWNPTAPGPARVRALARALTGSPAT